MASKRNSGLKLLLLLVVVALGWLVWQRGGDSSAGGTGTFVAGGKSYAYRLAESARQGRSARIELPDPGDGSEATLFWRDATLDDEFAAIAMERGGGAGAAMLAAELPAQQSGAALAYYVELFVPEGRTIRIPPGDPVVLRFEP